MQQKPIPILMYHSIASMPKGTKMRGLHVPLKRFTLQMRLLKMLGYRGVSMSKLKPYLDGKKIGKVVGITFDDGYQNNLRVLPILKKFGFSATCYLVSQKIGGVNDWDTGKGIKENPLMSTQEVEKWLNAGMEIGAHTQNHIRLSQVDKEIAIKEIEQSKSDLERKFSHPVKHFCYPYGDVNQAIIDTTKSAGYETATTVKRGRSTTQDNKMTLPRIPIVHRTMPHLFLMKILSNYEDKK